MTCAMRIHDPCVGDVRVKTIAGYEVPLCMRHGMLLARRRQRGGRRPPFRWQTDKQLEQWAAAKGLKASADTTPTGAASRRVTRKQSSKWG